MYVSLSLDLLSCIVFHRRIIKCIVMTSDALQSAINYINGNVGIGYLSHQTCIIICLLSLLFTILYNYWNNYIQKIISYKD